VKFSHGFESGYAQQQNNRLGMGWLEVVEGGFLEVWLCALRL
jgi:hypothetical protein